MRASTASALMPRRSATKSRLAVLTALLSLTAAAQALAPAGASAVAPNPTAGGCKPVSAAYPGAVWNGLEFCAPEQPGEVIEFESWFNPCVRNPSLCTAYQPNQGGGPLRVGEGSGGDGAAPNGAAGRRPLEPRLRGIEPTEPDNPKLPTKKECRFFKGRMVLDDDDRARLRRAFEEFDAGRRRFIEAANDLYRHINLVLRPRREELQRQLREAQELGGPESVAIAVYRMKKAELAEADRQIEAALTRIGELGDSGRVAAHFSRMDLDQLLARAWKKSAILQQWCEREYDMDAWDEDSDDDLDV